MVLEFNNDGALPEGIHEMGLEDFKKQFVYNNRREQIFKGFLKLIKDLRAINCKTVFVDGSFVTLKELPGDIDVCWDDDDEINLDLLDSDYQIFFDMDPPRDAQQSRYHADVFPANTYEGGSGMMFKDFFQQHKDTGNAKGIIKIDIRYDKE